MDHGCSYFKERFTIKDFIGLRVMDKIKPEYNGWIKHGWNDSQLYKGALAKWERFSHIKNKKKYNFSRIIDDSSLLITDYSSLAMDFIFQNKPFIFYLLDINNLNRSIRDKYNKKIMVQKMIFGNPYNSSNEVIENEILIENNFTFLSILVVIIISGIIFGKAKCLIASL